MSTRRKYETDDQAAARLADALKDLPENWIMCRDLKHAWSVEDNFHATVFKGKQIAQVRRSLVCLRCETHRHDLYVPTRGGGLEKVGAHYVYPENYQMHGVPRGVKPQSIVRQETYRRAMLVLAETKNGTEQNA